MTTRNIVSPKFFDVDHTSAIAVVRESLEQKHVHHLMEAKAAIREAVRAEFCEMFGVERTERPNDDGGGSIILRFPKGWTEDQATAFATDCLDIDCSYRYGGPGRYFQSGGVGTGDDGTVVLNMFWGMDI